MLCVLNGPGVCFIGRRMSWLGGQWEAPATLPLLQCIPRVPTRETESGRECVCLSSLSICPGMLGAGGPC